MFCHVAKGAARWQGALAEGGKKGGFVKEGWWKEMSSK